MESVERLKSDPLERTKKELDLVGEIKQLEDRAEFLTFQRHARLTYNMSNQDILFTLSCIMVRLKQLRKYSPELIKKKTVNYCLEVALEEKRDYDGDIIDVLNLLVNSLWKINSYGKRPYKTL
jgi:hypothetical protein